MAKKKAETQQTSPGACCDCGCRVESLVSVDHRGQMVLPKDLRDRAGIAAGDKLAIVTCEKDGRIHCMVLMKESDLAAIAKSILGPVVQFLT